MNFDDLNEIQQEIVTCDAPNVVVLSSAASGKTQVITQRIKYLQELQIDNRNIVVITFTNNAAENMRARLDNTDGLFIGTIHSYANYLLNAAGYATDDIIEEERFNDLFFKVSDHLDCVQPVEYLMLDEAQDSDELQFDFIFGMVRPHNWLLVGDLKQSIYSFKGSNPLLLKKLAQRSATHVFDMNLNYRNSRKILNFAKYIMRKSDLGLADTSIAINRDQGLVEKMDIDFDYLAQEISSNNDFKDWFVLCRSNAQVERAYNELMYRGIPCDTFKITDLNNSEVYEKTLENTVKVLTVHSAKGLEAKNVVVIGCRIHTHGEESCVSYVAATRAKNRLIWCFTGHKKKFYNERRLEW